MRNWTSSIASWTRHACRSVPAAAALLALLCLPSTATHAAEINYTFSGVIRVLDLSSPPPGSGATIPGVDPLGLDGAAVLLVCVIDSETAPSLTGTNGDGTYAFFNGGSATLAITGSAGGAVDGTYVEAPCSVRVDDFPVGSSYGGDVLSIVTTWDLGLPFPDVFQVPFAELAQDTFAASDLRPFSATDVDGFIGVNFSGSADAFYFEDGTGIAMGLSREAGLLSPAQRIGVLFADVEALPGLNWMQKRLLTNRLSSALTLLNRGWDTAATNQLGAFVFHLEFLISHGHLATEDGQPLIDEANEIIDLILAG